VNKVVTAILAVDDKERTLGLAEICYRRTLRNPHFLIEFVTILEEEDLIHFNLGLLNWVWDEERIDNETMSTANVVNLLQARMRKLPKQAQLLLEYAACLGSSFRLPTLELVWENHGVRISESPGDKNIVGMLSTLEEGNFIESCGVGVYRWVHDKVQEAALSLGNAADATFQFEIGFVLYHSLDPEELDESLFEVVNLIDKGNVKRRPEFAELNMHASEKAKKLSAFNSAATYVSTGINFLSKDKWTQYHDLTLHLYTLGAEVELALGLAEAMETYSSEVLSHSDCSALGKFHYIRQKQTSHLLST
jgi:predicted ATPase